MDAFDNVNFTSSGPVGTHRPPSRPYTASVRHRPEICNEQSTVVCLLRAYTNGFPVTLTRAQNCLVINGQDCRSIILNKGEAIVNSTLLGLIVYQSMCGIWACEEIPFIEKVLPLVHVLQLEGTTIATTTGTLVASDGGVAWQTTGEGSTCPSLSDGSSAEEESG